jgi:hypothetical protein
MGDVHEISGIEIPYLKAKSEKAFEKNCSYVVYHSKGEWKEITIDDGFHLPTVMKRLFERERNG